MIQSQTLMSAYREREKMERQNGEDLQSIGQLFVDKI